MTAAQTQVRDDDKDFYGKNYWLTHQKTDLGLPDIFERMRSDLPERCLHWLRCVLKYKPPPARVLELGCAHGGFVALLAQAGYDATGLELSPAIAKLAASEFGIQTLVGPVEKQRLPQRSFDVIALMDVLEHLPNPMRTMDQCLSLLKPDGILVIQTPRYPEDLTYPQMRESKHSFLDQLKADEHLYLLSQKSITEMFSRLKAPHISFEPAIFSHYDMALVVSKRKLTAQRPERIATALERSPSARLVRALLDLGDNAASLERQRNELEKFKRNAEEQVAQLTTWVKEARAEIGRVSELHSAASQREGEARSQSDRLTNSLQESRVREDQLHKGNAAAQQHVTALVQHLGSLTAEMETRLQESIRLQGELERSTTSASTFEREAATLKASLASAEKRIDELKQLASKTEADATAVREANANAREQISALTERLQVLKTNSEAMAREKQRLQQELASSLKAHAELKAEAAVLSSSSAIEQKRIKELTDAVGNLRSEAANLHADRARTLQELEKSRQTTARVEAEASEAREAAAAAKESNVDLAKSLQSANEEVAELHARSADVQSRISVLTEQVQLLQTEAEDLRAHKERAEEELQVMAKALHSSRIEKGALRAAMVAQAKSQALRIDALGSSRQKLTDEVVSASNRVRALTDEIKEVQGASGRISAENESLTDQLKSAVMQIETLTTWVREAREAESKLRVEHEKLVARRGSRLFLRFLDWRTRTFGKFRS